MAQSKHLSGTTLSVPIWVISCLCVVIFAYNAAVVGSALTVVSFQRQFPQMDTLGASMPVTHEDRLVADVGSSDTKGEEQHSNAQIQGPIAPLLDFSRSH